jgi:predicted ribosome quality control (RQC) complex YloA/Tae2 family protein
MKQHSAGIRKRVKNNITRLVKKRAKMLETLDQNGLMEENRIYGELLTANLHLIKKGATTVEVVNYYDDAQSTIEISLMPDISPSKNAQQYYKKYRKAKGAQQYAHKELGNIEKELDILENAMEDIDKCTSNADLNEIRYFMIENGFLRPDPYTGKRRKIKEGEPYRFRAADGVEIIVGKNAVQNDRITLHARANETWLHAQGVGGSHVIITTEDEPSEETLLFAAKVAAYFSKGRNHPSFPIDYTKRKYVKKKSGTPSGFVIYQNFKTIQIGLTLQDFEQIKQHVIGASGGVR